MIAPARGGVIVVDVRIRTGDRRNAFLNTVAAISARWGGHEHRARRVLAHAERHAAE